MEYQLVIQFPLEHPELAERLFEFEARLERMGDNSFYVDGNDVGSGEMNVFILTADPTATLNLIRPLIPVAAWTAAYRSLESDEYHVLHPVGLARFDMR